MSVGRLHLRHQGVLRGGTTRRLQMRSHVLLRVRRKLARSGAVSIAEEMDQEMRRRLGDVQLDSGQHQGMPQMQGDDRKGRRM